MQDLFMYFYQDNCDLNDGNYLIQTTIQCVCYTVLANKFCIRWRKTKELLDTDLLGCL